MSGTKAAYARQAMIMFLEFTVLTTFPILNDRCMEEHTCDLALPHINRKCGLRGANSGGQRQRTFDKRNDNVFDVHFDVKPRARVKKGAQRSEVQLVWKNLGNSNKQIILMVRRCSSSGKTWVIKIEYNFNGRRCIRLVKPR